MELPLEDQAERIIEWVHKDKRRTVNLVIDGVRIDDEEYYPGDYVTLRASEDAGHEFYVCQILSFRKKPPPKKSQDQYSAEDVPLMEFQCLWFYLLEDTVFKGRIEFGKKEIFISDNTGFVEVPSITGRCHVYRVDEWLRKGGTGKENEFFYKFFYDPVKEMLFSLDDEAVEFEEIGDAEDYNDEYCAICNGYGELICCDGCPQVFHLECVGVSYFKFKRASTWLCPTCVSIGKRPELKQMMERKKQRMKYNKKAIPNQKLWKRGKRARAVPIPNFNPKEQDLQNKMENEVFPEYLHLYRKAAAQLQFSAIPETLPCRDDERTAVEKFLKGAIKPGGQGRTLCVPGTGKTVTVYEVVKSLQNEVEEVGKFSFIEINGMTLSRPQQAYAILYEGLSGRRVSPESALRMLERRFSMPSPQRACMVVLVDELDMLVTRQQSVIYNLFNWPSLPYSRIAVIGIANTMDLHKRLLPKVASRMGLNHLVFLPYSKNELFTIVSSRLANIFQGVSDAGDLKIFEEDAIVLVSSKVANISGDARRALEICRKSVDIAEQEALTEEKVVPVTLTHILSATMELSSSTKHRALASVPHAQKMVLLAALYESMIEERDYIPFPDIVARYRQLAEESIRDISVSILRSCIDELISIGLMRPMAMSTYLHEYKVNVSPDDIGMVFLDDPGVSELLDYLLSKH